MKGKRLVAQVVMIAVLLFTSVISPNMVQANYGAPEVERPAGLLYIQGHS
ncbi:hypothetical protein [Halalkalibacter hemicellulosilyticus]|nr:hypothetical protein [Halalkalibacter hemicellulosilyticus]